MAVKPPLRAIINRTHTYQLRGVHRAHGQCVFRALRSRTAHIYMGDVALNILAARRGR